MEGGAMVREFRCPDERLSGRLIEAVSALREERPLFRPTFRLQLIDAGLIGLYFEPPVTDADVEMAQAINRLPIVEVLEDMP
ncbi:MAG: hypothetical protein D6692_04650 [Planctomycetota bacterium]|nr:MAG: hypothetical protein D6692_04650 [Planctomycetota bacterium]